MLMQPCKFDSGLEHFLITIYCLLSVSTQFLCNRNVKRPKRVQNNNSSNNNKQTNRNTDDREHWLKISMKISPVLSIARQNNTKNFMVILWLVQPQDKHKSVLEGVKSKHQLFTFMQHSKLGQRSVESHFQSEIFFSLYRHPLSTHANLSFIRSHTLDYISRLYHYNPLSCDK